MTQTPPPTIPPKRPPQAPPQSRRSPWRHAPLAVIAITAVTSSVLFSDQISFATLQTHRDALVALRESHFTVMVLAFMAAYVTIVAFSLPGATAATVTGGFLFGLVAGTMANVAAATIGALLIFLAARAGLGQMLAARLDASEGRVARLRDGLRRNEISVMFLMRLLPVVPFFVGNLLPALVGVKLRNFAFTTFLGIIPGALVFTSVGVGVGEVFDRGERPDLSLLWSPEVLGPLLGLAALSALPMLVRALRGKSEV